MKIIQHREYETCTEHKRWFSWRDDPGAGFSFHCDEQGNVDVESLPTAARENYQRRIDGTYNVRDDGVRTNRWEYTHSAIGLCDCGEEVYLDGFTNTCYECGADYNMSGQRLAPREQWGEETGESLADIIGPYREEY